MNVYLVAMRWMHDPLHFGPPELVDGTCSQFDDWFRYGPMTWLVRTQASAQEVSAAIRKAVHKDDSIIVLRVDPADISGWAPPQVWAWLLPETKENAA